MKMFKNMGLLKLGACVLALGMVNAIINPDDEKEVQVIEEVKEVKNEIDYSALNVEDIKRVITSIVDDETSDGEKRIANIEVTDKNYVFIDLKADKSINAYKSLEYSTELFAELKKFVKAEQMNIEWYATAIDTLGVESEVMIAKVGFPRVTLDKINFDNFYFENYKLHAAPYFIHPSWEIKLKN